MKRTSIVTAIANKLKEISVANGYNTDLYENAYPHLKFWDEVNNFPSIYISPGSETREYHPANFAWGFLNICIKLYCKGENSSTELENLLEDVEKCLNTTIGVIVYDSAKNYETSELSILSITTDEGLLAPYAVGEITLLVRYQVM